MGSANATSFVSSVISFRSSEKYSLLALPAPPELNRFVISIPIQPWYCNPQDLIKSFIGFVIST